MCLPVLLEKKEISIDEETSYVETSQPLIDKSWLPINLIRHYV